MVHVNAYTLPPTPLIPNSPHPLLHYPGLLSKKKKEKKQDNKKQTPGAEIYDPAQVHDLFVQNGWAVQWIFRYGPTQQSHYHSAAHECMAVLSGTATIRFGAADAAHDAARGPACEAGALEIRARAGDVFVLPAGLAHKTYDPAPPPPEFALLTPGGGHGISLGGADPRRMLEQVALEGYTMLGGYPLGSQWDFAVGRGDDGRHFREVWAVPILARDPVLGLDPEGLVGRWKVPRCSML